MHLRTHHKILQPRQRLLPQINNKPPNGVGTICLQSKFSHHESEMFLDSERAHKEIVLMHVACQMHDVLVGMATVDQQLAVHDHVAGRSLCQRVHQG